MRTPLRLTMLSAPIFSQNFLVSYWPGQLALASHWLAELTKFMPAYLIIGQS